MPAFDESAYYVIFFVVFLVICYFVYMNIILAVIYNNYRKHLKVISSHSLTLQAENVIIKEGREVQIVWIISTVSLPQNEVRKSVYSKRQQLSKAFEILAVSSGNK